MVDILVSRICKNLKISKSPTSIEIFSITNKLKTTGLSRISEATSEHVQNYQNTRM